MRCCPHLGQTFHPVHTILILHGSLYKVLIQHDFGSDERYLANCHLAHHNINYSKSKWETRGIPLVARNQMSSLQYIIPSLWLSILPLLRFLVSYRSKRNKIKYLVDWESTCCQLVLVMLILARQTAFCMPRIGWYKWWGYIQAISSALVPSRFTDSSAVTMGCCTTQRRVSNNQSRFNSDSDLDFDLWRRLKTDEYRSSGKAQGPRDADIYFT